MKGFEVYTEEELQMVSLLPEGIYSYQVVKAEDKPSKSKPGTEYTALVLKVWDKGGHEYQVYTNLALAKLLKHFCDVNDLQDEYKSGDVPSDLMVNKCGGNVIIGIEPEKPNPNGGMYKAKNIVKDYIFEPKHSGMKPLPDVKNDFKDDELPF